MDIIFIIILFFIIIEIILRILERDKNLLKFNLKEYPYYRYKPNRKGRSPWYTNQIGKKDTPIIEISELGIRGSFLPKKKNVLCLGCSFTEGSGLKDKDTYPGKLEELIDNNSYHVINAGLPGYGIFQIYKLFEDLIKEKPEIIILQTLDFYRYPLNPNIIRSGRFIFRGKELINRVSLIMNKLTNLITQDKYSHLGDPYFIHNEGLSKKEIWRLNKKYLDKIQKTCIAKNVKLMIFQWPGQIYFYTQIKNYCRDNNIFHADTSEIYSYYNEEELRLHKYDRHPNALANKLIAKSLYSALRNYNIL